MDLKLFVKGVEELGKALVDYGPWGVCAVLFILLIGLYWYMTKHHEAQLKELGGLLEKRNNQLVSLIQKCCAVISQAAATLEDSNEVLKHNQEVMEDLKATKGDLEKLYTKTNTLIDVCLNKKNK